ncbi:MAG TPA: hypothetical protein VFK70_18775 [Vicinamibacteria bacterium]|nr:hypothetical protein [Vicinamibacteria bacterium]
MTDHDWDDLVDAVTDVELPSGGLRHARPTRREWILIGVVVVLAFVVYLVAW